MHKTTRTHYEIVEIPIETEHNCYIRKLAKFGLEIFQIKTNSFVFKLAKIEYDLWNVIPISFGNLHNRYCNFHPYRVFSMYIQVFHESTFF